VTDRQTETKHATRAVTIDHIYTCGTAMRSNNMSSNGSYSHAPCHKSINTLTRMWANAQRDGRPAEYRWRPLFNAAKFG